VIVDPLEDLAAICGAATPAALWLYLVTTPTARAEINDFEALVAFKKLHSQGEAGALRSAAILCTDPRWRRCTATLIAQIEQSGILSDAELDELADGLLWDDWYSWPVPQMWLSNWGAQRAHKGRRRPLPVAVDRVIWPPLRRWASARVATRSPERAPDALARVETLDARGGDAVAQGLLDASKTFPEEARQALIELGCQWPNGTVRLQALRLLSAREPDRAQSLALADLSGLVRRHADRLRPGPANQRRRPGRVAPSAPEDDGVLPSDQLALFA
jgi:hypothetical protein